MTTTSAEGDVRSGRAALRVATASIALVLVVLGVAAIATIRLNNDAGYYLPCARAVARGLAPTRDFPTAYSPGAYYVMALFGVDRLFDPVLVKSVLYALHAANGVLMGLVLLRLGRPRAEAWFFAAVFAAWVFASDGLEFGLEPFVNVCVLGALLASSPGRDGPRAAFVAGVLAGAAVMMKQYAVVLLPFLFALAATTGDAPRLRRGVFFALGAPVAFLVFVVGARLNPVDAFTHLMTGGGYGGTYTPAGLRGVWNEIARDRTLATTIAVALLGAFVVATTRARRDVLCLGAFLAALLPLYVRQYPHYVQMAAPWGILLASSAVDVFAARLRAAPGARAVLALLVASPFVAPFASAAAHCAKRATLREATIDAENARLVVAALPAREDVLVLNYPQLYATTDLIAPRRDFRFLTDLEPPAEREIVAAGKLAVVAMTGRPAVELRDKLLARGFVPMGAVETRPRFELLRRAE